MSSTDKIVLPTRQLASQLVTLLTSLKAGDRIRVTQTVRVGAKKWTITTPGAFRGLNYLATGITTDRVKQDDVVVPTVHFTKDNGELASISLDEHSVVERN
jgi:hypothetical protein